VVPPPAVHVDTASFELWLARGPEAEAATHESGAFDSAESVPIRRRPDHPRWRPVLFLATAVLAFVVVAIVLALCT
jgi:hypothetical protein